MKIFRITYSMMHRITIRSFYLLQLELGFS
jgi:hypothetical protein